MPSSFPPLSLLRESSDDVAVTKFRVHKDLIWDVFKISRRRRVYPMHVMEIFQLVANNWTTVNNII